MEQPAKNRTWVRPDVRRGRGASSRPGGRYEPLAREAFDDGWDTVDEEPEKLKTIIIPDKSKSIISYNNSPDVGGDRTINPYRGCEHGCIYCFARPGHAFLGLSPGLDFESRLFVKFDAPKLLAKELRNPKYKPAPFMLSGVTDCYQPIEKAFRLTRQILEVLNDFSHPVCIVTKSSLVTRDMDLLKAMAKRNLASVAVSVTTLDRKLARAMEPRAATPPRRIAAIRKLTGAGIPVIVMFAPVIPGLNDHELDAVLQEARKAGATGAGYVMLRLPFELKDLFREWLEEHRPDRARRVMKMIRDVRGGRSYVAEFGERMRGTGPVARLIASRFQTACRRLGLNEQRRRLDISQFSPPGEPGDQLDLFP